MCCCFNFNIVKRRLPGQASIYTAELCAILLAMDVVNNSNKDKYVICVDSLSCLQAIEHQHIDHPLVLDVLEKCSALVNKSYFVGYPVMWIYKEMNWLIQQQFVFNSHYLLVLLNTYFMETVSSAVSKFTLVNQHCILQTTI